MTSIKSLLRLALVAVGLLFVSTAAQASSCFWVGGAGTWNGTNTTSWASSTGGTSGTCAATSGPIAGIPGPSDNATFDGSSGGGTVTANEPVYTGCTFDICLLNLTTSAFTGTIDFNADTQTGKISGGWTDVGSGTHTIDCGTGAWSFTVSGSPISFTGSGTTWNCSTSNWTIVNAAPSGQRGILLVGQAFGNFTISGSGSPGQNVFFSTVTGTSIASLTVSTACETILFTQAKTLLITAAPTLTSTSSCPGLITTNGASQATITWSTGTPTFSWFGFQNTVFGSGAVSPTNSFDFGNNNFDGGTLTGPSFSSSATGKIFP